MDAITDPSVNQGQLLTIQQVAKRLNVSIRTVQRLRRKEALPQPMQLGGSVRWNPETIETWIKLGCPGASTNALVGKANSRP